VGVGVLIGAVVTEVLDIVAFFAQVSVCFSIHRDNWPLTIVHAAMPSGSRAAHGKKRDFITAMPRVCMVEETVCQET
jgi:hypothetical protein